MGSLVKLHPLYLQVRRVVNTRCEMSVKFPSWNNTAVSWLIVQGGKFLTYDLLEMFQLGTHSCNIHLSSFLSSEV